MTTPPKIIVYSYAMAPNPQKLFQTLSLLSIPYSYVELPMTMPRPQLTDHLGITYRRTPLLSINGDMYIDNALIVSKLCALAASSSPAFSHNTISPITSQISDTTPHTEFNDIGQRAFQLATALIPPTWPLLHDAAFLSDRSELMGRPFDPAILPAIRPKTLSAMLSLLALVEREFLSQEDAREGSTKEEKKRFVLPGETPSMADVHLYWGLNWGLRYHEGARPEIDEKSHPRVFAWLSDVEVFLAGRKRETRIDILEAESVVKAGPGVEVSHAQGNLEGLSPGQKVSVTPVDTGRTGVQSGVLVGLNYEEVCLRNEEGVMMHFPRFGYEVVAVKDDKS